MRTRKRLRKEIVKREECRGIDWCAGCHRHRRNPDRTGESGCSERRIDADRCGCRCGVLRRRRNLHGAHEHYGQHDGDGAGEYEQESFHATVRERCAVAAAPEQSTIATMSGGAFISLVKEGRLSPNRNLTQLVESGCDTD